MVVLLVEDTPNQQRSIWFLVGQPGLGPILRLLRLLLLPYEGEIVGGFVML